MSAAPVTVVGAGLAGLRCAGLLTAAGHEVRVFEASDEIGGRARTDEVDGFLLDRGFQVLLTAYPEAREAFDYQALELGEFEPGALIRLNRQFSPLTDPVRRPGMAFEAARSPVIGFIDKLRLARMRLELTSANPDEILERADRSALESLHGRGFSEYAIDRFFRPFFGGVLIDPELSTSSRLMEIFFRCFAKGSAALPARGMGQLAAGLAAALPEGSIHLEAPVREVRPDEIRRDDGEWEGASAVVVATDERSAAHLTELPEPGPGRTTTCFYFDVPEDHLRGKNLMLSPANRGPINELAIPSSVSPAYAPAGRSLVSVSAVGKQADRPDLNEAVRSQLEQWFGREKVNGWNQLADYRVEDALPDFGPGRFVRDGLDPRLESGLFICGDHRESPSIQGALVSGRKAAEAVLARL